MDIHATAMEAIDAATAYWNHRDRCSWCVWSARCATGAALEQAWQDRINEMTPRESSHPPVHDSPLRSEPSPAAHDKGADEGAAVSLKVPCTPAPAPASEYIPSATQP